MSDEERMIRDAAHAYCQEKLLPRVLMANRHESFEREVERVDSGKRIYYSVASKEAMVVMQVLYEQFCTAKPKRAKLSRAN